MMLQFGMAALFFLIHPVVAFVDARLCRGSLAQNQGIAAHRSTHAERMLLIQFRQDCMEILFECFSSRIIAAGHEHQELIAAHAGRNAVSWQCPPDRLRHHAQGRIAALMAMGIVDGILRPDSKYHVSPSMSSPGCPYDNAAMENFFGTLKTECLYRARFSSRTEVEQLVSEYVYFYNYERISLKNGLTPVEFRGKAA